MFLDPWESSFMVRLSFLDVATTCKIQNFNYFFCFIPFIWMYFGGKRFCLTWNLHLWISMGKALNFIGQMKVIRVAKAYRSWCLSSIQTPSSFDSTEWVSKAFKLRISTSGSHKFRRMFRFTAVSLEPLSSCKATPAAGLDVVVVDVLVVLSKQNPLKTR